MLVSCRPMRAPFLLDNSIEPARNLSFNDLYKRRIQFGEAVGNWGDDQGNGELVWNAQASFDGIGTVYIYKRAENAS